MALKVLDEGLPKVGHLVEQLQRVVGPYGLLSHRALPEVDGPMRLNGRWSVAMGPIEGQPLRLLIGEPMPAGPALQICGEIAGALDVLHGGDLVHGGLMPDNVLLSTTGEVRLLDVGLGRPELASDEGAVQSLLFERVNMVAPERLDGVLGPQSDVYSLGALLFELLTGTGPGKPFAHARRHAEQVDAHGQRLAEVVGESGIVDLVRSMLAYEPEDRPSPREVEHRCTELRAQQRGELLRDWAAAAIKKASALTAPIDELTGRVLNPGDTPLPSMPLLDSIPPPLPPVPETEWVRRPLDSGSDLRPPANVGGQQETVVQRETLIPESVAPPSLDAQAAPPQPAMTEGSLPPTSSQPPPEASTGAGLLAAGGVVFALVAIGVLVLVVGVALVWYANTPADEGSEVTIEAVAPEKPRHIVDTGKDAMELEEEGAVAEDRPATPRKRAIVPGAMVEVTGDAEDVVLVSGDDKFALPGKIPAGSYDIEARFGAEATLAGHVEVPESGAITLACQSMFALCKPK